MKRPEIIEAIRETLKRVAPNAQAILYGSEARGDARHDSDVDLLILVEGDKMTLAKVGQATEHKYLGCNCGIMTNSLLFMVKQAA